MASLHGELCAEDWRAHPWSIQKYGQLGHVVVVGAGLAGCEVAWQLAQAGLQVKLIEMKPAVRTPAQCSDLPAELVCSNSLRSSAPQNAVGLLKEEMAQLDSLILRTAKQTAVPAGDALAVDRVLFGQGVAQALAEHPRIEQKSQVVDRLPPADAGPVVLATGPLTHPDLAGAIAEACADGKGDPSSLYFYDAIAPIVLGSSIDTNVAFAQSRYDKGSGADYLNCPFADAEAYGRFIAAVQSAETMPLHAFEEAKYFQGCLPIEVLASRGLDTLRFGAMKPVGLCDPNTGKQPHAVVQLRKEDVDGQAYNLVGFQTKMKYPEQKRIFKTIPGLENAEFVRLGAIHRNTYLNSPKVLTPAMALKGAEHVHFAGQITGVEGYVESAAHGLLTARTLAARLFAASPEAPFWGERKASLAAFDIPPATTALGALWRHVLGVHRIAGRAHEPQNIHWAMMPALPATGRKKMPRAQAKEARLLRARTDFASWRQATGLGEVA